jgi:hypothetical protein
LIFIVNNFYYFNAVELLVKLEKFEYVKVEQHIIGVYSLEKGADEVDH